MKKYFKILLICLCSLLLIIPLKAEVENSFVYDDAGLLNDAEKTALISECAAESEKLGFQIAFYFTAEEFKESADLDQAVWDKVNAHFNELKIAEDGLLLYYNSNLNSIRLLHSGSVSRLYDETAINELLKAFKAECEQAHYYQAANVFLKQLASIETGYLKDDAHYLGEEEKEALAVRLNNHAAENDYDIAIFTSDTPLNNAELQTLYLNTHCRAEGVALAYSKANRSAVIALFGKETPGKLTKEQIDVVQAALMQEEDPFNALNSFITNIDFYYRHEYIPDGKGDALLVDLADLFTESEEKTIQAELKDVSARLGIDVVLYTTEEAMTKSLRDEAADIYDYHNYAAQGTIFYINMADRRMIFVTTGEETIAKFSEEECASLEDNAAYQLHEGQYLAAAQGYIEDVEKYYQTDSAAIHNRQTALVIALITAGVVTAAVGMLLRGQMKSVHAKRGAQEYATNQGSFFTKAHISAARDIYLYSTTTRTYDPPQRSSSGGGGGSFRGSSGASHGGGSGRSF